MTRIADALKRVRSGSSVGSDGGDSRVEGTIQFFAPGQPAVVSPWEIADESPETPGAGRSSRPLDRVVARSASADAGDHVDRYVGFPAEETADKLVVSPATTLQVRAQYNKLAAALHQTQAERGAKVLMVISAGPAEGKTLTAVNLALTLSEVFQRRVLLVDADLRKPAAHQLLGLSNTRGLADLLDGERPLPIVRINPRLSLLPAGDYRDDPIKVVTSEQMWSLIEESRARFDWIVIDTPPLGLVPDARILAPMTDGALLVAMAGTTTCDAIQNIAATFEPSRLLGVVLNRVTARAGTGTQNGYYDLPER